MYVGVNSLGAQDQATSFQTYWALFFACTGFIDGIMQETTRAVAAGRSHEHAGSTHAPWRLGAAVAVAAAVLAIVTAPLWRGYTELPHLGTGVSLLAAGLASYAFQAVVSGLLSGLQLWGSYARLMALDSGVRLVLVVIAFAAGWGLDAFLVVTVIGAASWLVMLAADARVRAAVGAGIDVEMGTFVRRAGSAMAASGASAIVITGIPLLINGAFPTAGSAVTVAGIINAVTLTRAPVLVPLQRFQSALIVRFVQARSAWSSLALPVAAVLGVGVVGAAAAWALGPWILRTFYRADLFVPGHLLAALTFDAACTGVVMVTGAAVVAAKAHRAYVGGWLAAAVVAWAVLNTPLALEPAVCLALLVGPLAGAAVHTVAFAQAARSGKVRGGAGTGGVDKHGAPEGLH
nr:hypothetical protein [Corynebacterium sp. c6VSa_13]